MSWAVTESTWILRKGLSGVQCAPGSILVGSVESSGPDGLAWTEPHCNHCQKPPEPYQPGPGRSLGLTKSSACPRLWQFAHPRPLSLLQRGLASRSKGPDPSSKATLWVKAQHEGELPPPCIVRKDPRVPHTAGRGA